MTCNISRLADHILVIIFLRLPITSVIQCKYVCKLWLHIIENHYLGKVPLSITKPTEHFLCLKNKNLYWLEFHGKSLHFDLAAKVKWRPFQYFWSPPQFVFLNSCNGLLCVCQDLDTMHIINPMTNEYITLPSCEVGRRFHPNLCGLGFDPSNQEFKVIRVSCDTSNSRTLQADVCTLRNGTWRSIHMPLIGDSSFDHFHAFIDGSLHCLVYWGDLFEMAICAFDFQEENFRRIPLPAVTRSFISHDFINIGVFEDKIYVCLFDYWAQDDDVEVWLMKEYGVVQSWTKMLIMRNKMLFKNFWGLKYIHLLGNGDVLIYRSPRNDRSLFIDSSPDMFLYDPWTNRTKMLKAQGIESRIRPIDHQSSFVSLKHVVEGSFKVLNANEDPKLKMKVFNVRENTTLKKKMWIYWKRMGISAFDLGMVCIFLLVAMIMPLYAFITYIINIQREGSVWYRYELWIFPFYVFFLFTTFRTLFTPCFGHKIKVW